MQHNNQYMGLLNSQFEFEFEFQFELGTFTTGSHRDRSGGNSS